MSQVFRRVESYETSAPSGIEDSWLGPVPTPVWLCGSGPSLTPEVAAHVRRSGAPVMCVNFSGRGPDGSEPMLWPDFWTAFDPTARFHKSIFLSPRTMKFVVQHFKLDIVPGTNYKVCDCPNVHFFEREHRGYADFLAPCSGKILDCLDSFAQAVDILFRLGFRTIYTVGTEMRVRISAAQQSLVTGAGLQYDPELGVLVPPAKTGGRPMWSTRLTDLLTVCRNVPPGDRGPGEIRLGEDRTAIAQAFEAVEDREPQYAFSERKRFLSAVATDNHYFNVVQFMRLSRKCFAKHGVRLVDCSGGRLSEFFEARTAAEAADDILSVVGDASRENTAGRYERRGDPAEQEPGRTTMVDLPPHQWHRTSRLREGAPVGDCGCGRKKAPKRAEPKPEPQAEMPEEQAVLVEGGVRVDGGAEVVVDEVA